MAFSTFSLASVVAAAINPITPATAAMLAIIGWAAMEEPIAAKVPLNDDFRFPNRSFSPMEALSTAVIPVPFGVGALGGFLRLTVLKVVSFWLQIHLV